MEDGVDLSLRMLLELELELRGEKVERRFGKWTVYAIENKKKRKRKRIGLFLS